MRETWPEPRGPLRHARRVRRGDGRAGSLAATASQALRPDHRIPAGRALAAVAVLAAAGVAAALALRGGEAAPARGGVLSAAGLYAVALAAPPAGSPVNELHAWRLDLSDAGGEPVTGASIAVEGDMPAHGHGLPTQPQVRELGGGRYEVEGMKFQMGGEWLVELRIDGGRGRDTVRFEFTLPA
jgi:hypothetical protein